MPIDDTYSPVIHRLNQAIKRRAVKPDEPVQPPAEILIQFSHPPKELVDSSKTQLTKLIAAANIKKGRIPSSPLHRLLILFQFLLKPRESGAETSLNLSLASTSMQFLGVRSVRRLARTIPFQSSNKCSILLTI